MIIQQVANSFLIDYKYVENMKFKITTIILASHFYKKLHLMTKLV